MLKKFSLMRGFPRNKSFPGGPAGFVMSVSGIRKVGFAFSLPVSDEKKIVHTVEESGETSSESMLEENAPKRRAAHRYT